MLTLIRVHLPSDVPIVACELKPYVLHQRPDKNMRIDDVPESAPIGRHFLRYRWYRLQSDDKVPVCSLRPSHLQSDDKVIFCSVHPSVIATVQCLACSKANIPAFESYHCTTKCYSDSWHHHRVLHDHAASAMNENANVAPSAVTQKIDGKTWIEVGCCKSYTPTAEDIGHVLKFECAVVNSETMFPLASSLTVSTSHVIPAPSPSPRHIIPVNGADLLGKSDLDDRKSSPGTFTVLSYNILADVHVTSDTFSYCPSWALSWQYRRQNLLREIVGYRADIVCLQEVQSDHYEEFFVPELDKHGYQALYKRKTNEVYNVSIQTIDGCATFFRRDRFSLVKKYEVEFNKAAQSLTEPATIPAAQKRDALNRLITDDVALIVVLESKFSTPTVDSQGKRQLVCVANTHIIGNQDLMDVRLWQVHTLLKGLEKLSDSADIPMMICGNFNSIPGSAAHHLLTRGKVNPAHPDLAVDPLNLCRSHDSLTHELPLVSAYSSLAMKAVGIEFGNLQQRKGLDHTTNEPLFTCYTRDFIGTLDYIFYTADTITVESLLELLDEESLRKDAALPSPKWSSNHIAILAEFWFKSWSRR